MHRKDSKAFHAPAVPKGQYTIAEEQIQETCVSGNYIKKKFVIVYNFDESKISEIENERFYAWKNRSRHLN